jgi:endonuclease/exonuclease/phosphatase family metal-dependent hydrolase
MRIATFNIQHGRGPDGEVDLDRLAAATALLDADVLALQEVDVEVPRSHGANLAAIAAGDMAFAFAPAMAIRHGWYGNALTVRGAIDDAEVVELPGEEGDEPRVAVLATMRPEAGGVITVAATHLSIRAHIARLQLEAVLSTLVDRRPPHVLLGDLNLTPRIVEPAVASAGLALADTKRATFPAHRPRIRIDHIAVSRDLQLEQVDVVQTPVSDHRALVAAVTRQE